MQLTSVFQHFPALSGPVVGIIITAQNKNTFWPAQTEIAFIVGFHGKQVGWCLVWLMILFTYLNSLWTGHRWGSWDRLVSSDQNANSVVGLHHNLLLWFFNLDNVMPSQVCSLSYNLSSPRVTDLNREFTRLFNKHPKTTHVYAIGIITLVWGKGGTTIVWCCSLHFHPQVLMQVCT